MGRKGRPGRIPSWWKGKKILDDIDGSEHYEDDSDMRRQRGLNVHKSNYDDLTDQERQDNIKQIT